KPTLEFLRAESWTAWEPIAGTDGDRSLLVVRRSALPLIGSLLAVFLCVAFWGLREHLGRWRLSLLLIWLTFAGLGYLWLPATLRILVWWPLLAAAAVALAWYLATAVRKQPGSAPRTNPLSGPAPIAMTGLLFIVGPVCWMSVSSSHADD